MKFTLIDMNNWDRKEYFEHYYQNIPCTYSMSVKMDITSLKQRGKHLYSALLFFLTQIINQHREFRFSFDNQGRLGYFDEMLPSYTVFNPETETFTSIWSNVPKKYEDFYDIYKSDVETFGKNKGVVGKPNMPENVFNVSMIPWMSFEGFNLNLQKGYDYLLPIFTFGKYFFENEKCVLPLSIQVHHAVCDGFHVCRLVQELQDFINSLR